MDAESFVEKVKSGTITQSEAEEVNKSQALRLIADVIKALPNACGPSNGNTFISPENFAIIMNCGAFVVMSYDKIDYINFGKMVGREALMSHTNGMLFMLHSNPPNVPWNPWCQIFNSLVEYAQSGQNPNISMKPAYQSSKDTAYKKSQFKSKSSVRG